MGMVMGLWGLGFKVLLPKSQVPGPSGSDIRSGKCEENQSCSIWVIAEYSCYLDPKVGLIIAQNPLN